MKHFTEDAATILTYNISWRLHTWERLANTVSKYPTGENVSTAYHTTIHANQQLPGEDVASLEELYKLFHMYYVSPITNISIPSMLDEAEGIDRSAALLYSQTVFRASSGRRFCVTKEGYMALVPTSTRRGDNIILLSGGLTPYVVRRKRKGIWVFIGECYVHGLMHGEGWNPNAELKEFTFV